MRKTKFSGHNKIWESTAHCGYEPARWPTLTTNLRNLISCARCDRRKINGTLKFVSHVLRTVYRFYYDAVFDKVRLDFNYRQIYCGIKRLKKWFNYRCSLVVVLVCF